MTPDPAVNDMAQNEARSGLFDWVATHPHAARRLDECLVRVLATNARQWGALEVTYYDQSPEAYAECREAWIAAGQARDELRYVDAPPGAVDEVLRSDREDQAPLDKLEARELRATHLLTALRSALEGSAETESETPSASDLPVAYQQCCRAMEMNSELKTDDEVYAWLANREGGDLPTLETWKRNVRRGRSLTGTQKRRRGRGSPTRSVVRLKDLDYAD